MFGPLPSWPEFAAFLIASVVLAVTPGPGVVFIVSRSVADGRQHGLASVLGVALGNLGNALAASAGLAAMFAISTAAFSVVKYSGACYLVYLGLRTLRSSRVTAQPMDVVPAQRLGRVVRDGFLVALLNPKTALFFAAFLPQFLGPGAASLLQTAVLGGIFVAVAAVTDTVYAVVAGAVAPALARALVVQPFGRYVSGVTLVGLGLFTALTPSRSAR
jgi:threonine/homoserine/homoserine lactone efflux protein